MEGKPMSEDGTSNDAASDSQRFSRLRERIGTPTGATQRQEISNRFARQQFRDEAHFRDSFLELSNEIGTIGPGLLTDELFPPFTPHVPVPGDLHRFTAAYDFAAVDYGTSGAGSAIASTGKIYARQSKVNTGDAMAWAVVGVRFRPSRDCTLSVWPGVSWSGDCVMQHRDDDPDRRSQAHATALGQIGIYIGSYAPGGTLWHEDASHWRDVWYRSEPNPSGSRNYQGTIMGSDLRLDGVLASKNRTYEIQIGVRAYASVLDTFYVTAGADAGIYATVSYFFVKEVGGGIYP